MEKLLQKEEISYIRGLLYVNLGFLFLKLKKFKQKKYYLNKAKKIAIVYNIVLKFVKKKDASYINKYYRRAYGWENISLSAEIGKIKDIFNFNTKG